MRAILLLSLLTAPIAMAKSPGKMSPDELIAMLADDSKGNRMKAADEIKKRRLAEATDALGTVCKPSEEHDVCVRALWALQEITGDAAENHVVRALMTEGIELESRRAAFRVLEKMDKSKAGQAAGVILADYRNVPPVWTVNLLDAIVAGNNRSYWDYTILIAQDVTANRRIRVKALDLAEKVKHPRLYEAQIALLTDDEKKLQVRCAQGLGRSGLPANEVVPPLMTVAQHSDKGDVRAAALKSLRSYASPELLPLVNQAVVNEVHLGAATHAYILFEALADQSSVPSLQTLLRREGLPDETLITLIHTGVRIGDPAVIPELQFLFTNHANEVVRLEADRAIAALGGPPEQRTTLIASMPSVQVTFVTDAQPTPPPPPLALSVDVNGHVAGVDMMVGDMQFGASVQTTTTSSASCCINGAFYSCPGLDAANVCFDDANPDQCSRDTYRDGECSQ